jgi:hypothetical protein
MFAALFFALLTGAPPPPDLRLSLLTTEGGANPGEERFDLSGDGVVV